MFLNDDFLPLVSFMLTEESSVIEVDEVPSRPLSPIQQLDIMKAIETTELKYEKEPIRRDLEVSITFFVNIVNWKLRC